MNILKYPQLKFYPFHMAIDPGKLWSPTPDNLVTFDMVSHWPLQIVHTHSPSFLPQLHLQPLDLPVNDGELLRPQPPLLKLLVHVQAEETSQRWTERWRWLWWITMDCYHCVMAQRSLSVGTLSDYSYSFWPGWCDTFWPCYVLSTSKTKCRLIIILFCPERPHINSFGVFFVSGH